MPHTCPTFSWFVPECHTVCLYQLLNSHHLVSQVSSHCSPHVLIFLQLEYGRGSQYRAQTVSNIHSNRSEPVLNT